jgi:hypothetical protein
MVNGHEMVQESNNQGSDGLKAHRNDYGIIFLNIIR